MLRVQNEGTGASRFRKQQVTEIEKHNSINLKRLSEIKCNNLSSSLIFFYFSVLNTFLFTFFKQRPRAGKENITVLAVCIASGVALGLLIVYKGKRIQENWYGTEALPNTYYRKSKNGRLKLNH